VNGSGQPPGHGEGRIQWWLRRGLEFLGPREWDVEARVWAAWAPLGDRYHIWGVTRGTAIE
jgi:hypothetical protein